MGIAFPSGMFEKAGFNKNLNLAQHKTQSSLLRAVHFNIKFS
jgi:hypothetical protein